MICVAYMHAPDLCNGVMHSEAFVSIAPLLSLETFKNIDASVHSDAKISELEAVLCDMNELCAARQSTIEELEPKLQASETLAVSLQRDLDELRGWAR